MLRIVMYPHPALRFESVPVRRIDDSLRSQVRSMFDLMYEARGIGLAANQVALPYQFFILNLSCDPSQPDQERVYINPEIIKRHSGAEEEEGCLSFPGLYGQVHRAKRVRLRAYDLDGNEVTVDADDLLSRAIQHETDHLHGRLFIDHFDAKSKSSTAEKVRAIENELRQSQAAGAFPTDEEILHQLRELAGNGPEIA